MLERMSPKRLFNLAMGVTWGARSDYAWACAAVVLLSGLSRSDFAHRAQMAGSMGTTLGTPSDKDMNWCGKPVL